MNTPKQLRRARVRRWHGHVSFSFSLSQVQSNSILVQTETSNGVRQCFDNVSHLPPSVIGMEQTGPVSGRTVGSDGMFGQQLYSQLIYSPSWPVSAHIDSELSEGSSHANYSAPYVGGVQQYTGCELTFIRARPVFPSYNTHRMEARREPWPPSAMPASSSMYPTSEE